MFEREIPVYESPCAMPGLTSFRYRGAYGWVMIGAKNIEDALKEASRSIGKEADVDNLQVYFYGEYVPFSMTILDYEE